MLYDKKITFVRHAVIDRIESVEKRFVYLMYFGNLDGTIMLNLHRMNLNYNSWVLNLWLIGDSFHVTVSCLICFPAV